MDRNDEVESLPFNAQFYYRRILLDTYPLTWSPFDWSGLGEWDTTSFLKVGREAFFEGEYSNLANSPFPFSECKYCGGRLDYTPEVQGFSTQDWYRGDAIECARCGWWLYAWSKNEFYMDLGFENKFWESAVHAFDYQSAEAPIAALRRQIEKDDIDLRAVVPRDLERLVTSVFRDHLGCKAEHVGQSGDGGVDVLILDRDPPLAIQVKRRATTMTEGPAVVRELVGALAVRGLHCGAIVTTAESFSKQARATATAGPLVVQGYEIDLYAYDAFRSVVKATARPPRPWLTRIYDADLSPEDVALKRARNGGVHKHAHRD